MDGQTNLKQHKDEISPIPNFFYLSVWSGDMNYAAKGPGPRARLRDVVLAEASSSSSLSILGELGI